MPQATTGEGKPHSVRHGCASAGIWDALVKKAEGWYERIDVGVRWVMDDCPKKNVLGDAKEAHLPSEERERGLRVEGCNQGTWATATRKRGKMDGEDIRERGNTRGAKPPPPRRGVVGLEKLWESRELSYVTRNK